MKLERNAASGARSRMSAMRRRKRSPSPHRRMRRSNGLETCWSERSKYGTPVEMTASIRSSDRSEGYRYNRRTQSALSVTARTSETIEPAPNSSGRSLPYEARSWAISTISRASSDSTSARIDDTSRLRWGPRNEGIAQNPHDRSQPSAIFTYAHGELDLGRGRLSRSSIGAGPAGDTPSDLRPSVTGTPKPATWSTSGSASASSAP